MRSCLLICKLYYKSRIRLGHGVVSIEKDAECPPPHHVGLVSMVPLCQRMLISSSGYWYQIVLIRFVLSIVHIFAKGLVLDEVEVVARPNLSIYLDLITTQTKTVLFVCFLVWCFLFWLFFRIDYEAVGIQCLGNRSIDIKLKYAPKLLF